MRVSPKPRPASYQRPAFCFPGLPTIRLDLPADQRSLGFMGTWADHQIRIVDEPLIVGDVYVPAAYDHEKKIIYVSSYADKITGDLVRFIFAVGLRAGSDAEYELQDKIKVNDREMERAIKRERRHKLARRSRLIQRRASK